MKVVYRIAAVLLGLFVFVVLIPDPAGIPVSREHFSIDLPAAPAPTQFDSSPISPPAPSSHYLALAPTLAVVPTSAAPVAPPVYDIRLEMRMLRSAHAQIARARTAAPVVLQATPTSVLTKGGSIVLPTSAPAAPALSTPALATVR